MKTLNACFLSLFALLLASCKTPTPPAAPVAPAAKPAPPPAASAPAPAAPRPYVFHSADGKCTLTIDTSGAPELKEWSETKLAPVLADWYPKIVAMLPS